MLRRRQRQRFGAVDPDSEDDTPDFDPNLAPATDSGFQTPDHRKLASARNKAFEGQPSYQGAAFREVARALLPARDWKEGGSLRSATGRQRRRYAPGCARWTVQRDRGACPAALAEHRFMHWPKDADLVLNPMTMAMGACLTEEALASSQPDRSLRALYALWREQRRLAEGEALKSADERLLVVRRFQDLIDTKPVTAITTRDICSFRDLCFKLPSRVKKSIKALPAKNAKTGFAFAGPRGQ